MGWGRSVAIRVAALPITALLPVVATACGSDDADAYGNFEATEVVVSAEVGGRLLHLGAVEGVDLPERRVVGLLDTTQLALQLAELRAQRSADHARTGQATAQVGALEAELRGAERELARTRRLLAEEAATEQQLDAARTQVEVLRARIRAAGQQRANSQELTGATEARIAQLEDRLMRSHVRNPVAGTVLTTYARAGELVQPGQPLYRIAALDTLELRAYVSGAQLARLRLGERVVVRFDAARGETLRAPGTVSWISSTAEFTPTPIQTRDERADLVYAFKVRVANPRGMIKIGMPGEVEFRESPPRRNALR